VTDPEGTTVFGNDSKAVTTSAHGVSDFSDPAIIGSV